jgi:7-alpha-hydroxysteroid dehydrogenase
VADPAPRSRTALDPDAIRLDGRVAIVTGAGAGIGAATATALARFGCDVAICDRDLEGLAATARQLEALGRHHFAEVLDVGDAEATIAWITGAAAVLGPIDIVVNNVIDNVGGENFTSATGVIEAAVGLLVDGGGSIINITKAERDDLARPLALELAPRQVRFNCVSPDAGHPDDVAAAVVWLASPMSRFVTGATLHVDSAYRL